MGALGDPYASVVELSERLDSTDMVRFPGILNAASRAVESFSRRQFNKTTTPTARRFRAVDWRRVPVDDFHTVTGLAVSVDGTAWNVTDVDPRPVNGIVDGQSGWPFFELIAVNRTWPWSDRAVVTVTAQWGWTAVPEAVKQATLSVAANMIGSGGSSYPVKAEAWQEYRQEYQLPTSGASDEVPTEMVTLVPYRRRRFGIA